MSDLFEAADSIIKKAAGAPMKPVFRPVDYAFHYGQLAGAIMLAFNRAQALEDADLRKEIVRLHMRLNEIRELILAQTQQNEEALK